MYNQTKPYKKQIFELIKKTWDTPYISVRDGIYPIFEKKFSFPEIDHTDGIGTKGVYHWQQRTFKNAVLDALAMNINDLILMRAVPYKLQNHILIQEDDEKAILDIVKNLSKECKKRNIAITGGETSIHNNINGLDLSLTISGFIKNYKLNRFEIGDFLIGIKSNGLHSNGFTKIKEVFNEEFKQDFIVPTMIYLDEIYSLEEKVDIHGMMHITGGAYTKLKDILQNADILIKRNHRLKPHQIFIELYNESVSDEEMYKTFNCGIGFVLSISKQDVNKINSRSRMDVIGEVIKGTGKVRLESMFSDKIIEL